MKDALRGIVKPAPVFNPRLIIGSKEAILTKRISTIGRGGINVYPDVLHLSWMKMIFQKNDISQSPVKVLEQLETIYNVKLTDKKTGLSTTKTVSLTEEQEKI